MSALLCHSDRLTIITVFPSLSLRFTSAPCSTRTRATVAFPPTAAEHTERHAHSSGVYTVTEMFDVAMGTSAWEDRLELQSQLDWNGNQFGLNALNQPSSPVLISGVHPDTVVLSISST